MKKATLAACLAAALAVAVPGQQLDFPGMRSEEQLRGGVQAYHRGFYSDSLVSIEKALSFKPSNELAQAWLGRVLWKSGFEQDAVRAWERLANAGKGSSVIRDWIQTVKLRNGTARETAASPPLVVSAELDGNRKGEYPLRRPTSVRPRADGSFFVAAFGSNEVLLVDANFRVRESLKGGLEGWDRPYDVLETEDGTLFVSEYGGNRIAKCNSRGDKLKVFGRMGRGDGELLGPQYLAADASGYLYVSDWGNSRINKYDRDGKFILSIGGLDGPSGLAVREDRIYVAENRRKRISVYDSSGNFLRTIGEGTLQDPEGISFTPEGSLLVADSNHVLEADLERDVWRVRADVSSHSTRLVHLSESPNGDTLGVDFDANRVLLLSDTASLYSGYAVRVDRVNAAKFPEVFADVTVEDRLGRPIVGLDAGNFVLTESHRSVGEVTLALANTDVHTADVALLVESSPAMSAFRPEVQRAAADMFALVTQAGRIKAVSAGERPVREADFGETRLRFISAALHGDSSARWKLDAAVRLAGEELLTDSRGAKRAVVFLTSGGTGQKPFSTYSLTELAAFLRNNSIAFYPVFFGAKGLDEELSFLASETGGKGYPVLTPGGMADVVSDIRARVTPLYTLRYVSPSEPEFGTRYIRLEVEAAMQMVSGRDESGYYSPPSAAGTIEPLKIPAPARTE